MNGQNNVDGMPMWVMCMRVIKFCKSFTPAQPEVPHFGLVARGQQRVYFEHDVATAQVTMYD
jgi:hypothetical protein